MALVAGREADAAIRSRRMRVDLPCDGFTEAGVGSTSDKGERRASLRIRHTVVTPMPVTSAAITTYAAVGSALPAPSKRYA